MVAKFVLISWLLFSAVFTLNTAAENSLQDVADTTSPYSLQALQQDFLHLRGTLEENHANLYAFTAKADMNKLMERQYGRIRAGMTLPEFFVLLTPIVAAIGCGHTNVWMPMRYWEQPDCRLFPLRIRLFDDVVVAGSYTEDEQLPRGTVLLRLNGRPFADIIHEMKANYPADAMNPYFIHKAVERRFPMIYSRRFGFPDAYRVTYVLPGGKEPREKSLQPASNEAVRKVVFKNFQDPELRLELLDDHHGALLRIQTFSYYDRVQYFKTFLSRSFAEIQQKAIANLILDLRGNDGGDPFCAAPLFSYLEPKPLPYFADLYGKYAGLAVPIPRAEHAFTGNLLILVDGRCFSTTGHVLALLKYHGIGRFIGTATGATYTCNAGKNTRTTLPNTGIMLYFGRSAFAAAVRGMDKSKPIMPDVTVQETYADFLAGRDTCLEAALRLCAK